MLVERYQAEKHERLVSTWAETRNRVPTLSQFIPRVGFVVGGIACGFLYQTDTRLALIENLNTDPASLKEDRARALDLLVDTILKSAWALGFTTVIGTTHLPAITDRAKRHGFTVVEKPTILVVRQKREGESDGE